MSSRLSSACVIDVRLDLRRRGQERTYGVMGIELRIREPSAEGVAPLRLVCADLSVGDAAWAFRAGVSRTSLRNWELFIMLSLLLLLVER